MGYEEFYQLEPIAKPAAGNGMARKIPGETWEKLLFARTTFTSSVAVANRLVFMDFLDGDGNTIGRFQSNSAQAASLTTGYTFGVQLSSTAVGGTSEVDVAIPDAILYPGFSVSFGAFAIQAADQFGTASLYVCRYPSGEWADSPGATPYRPEVIVQLP